MARRTKNPTTLETVLWASGAALIGILAGYGLSNLALRRRAEGQGLATNEWRWWVDEITGLLELGMGPLDPLSEHYVATIQSPSGAQTQLSPRKSREAAEKTATDAIAERGGVAVEGKPILG